VALGFNAATEKYEDLVKTALSIPPRCAHRIALRNAASLVGLLIIIEAMIADKPERRRMRARSGRLLGFLFLQCRAGRLNRRPFWLTSLDFRLYKKGGNFASLFLDGRTVFS